MGGGARHASKPRPDLCRETQVGLLPRHNFARPPTPAPPYRLGDLGAPSSEAAETRRQEALRSSPSGSHRS
jgi:hypothetical protein